jgi:hypothetical protein
MFGIAISEGSSGSSTHHGIFGIPIKEVLTQTGEPSQTSSSEHRHETSEISKEDVLAHKEETSHTSSSAHRHDPRENSGTSLDSAIVDTKAKLNELETKLEQVEAITKNLKVELDEVKGKYNDLVSGC